MADGRLTNFESETRCSAECHICGAESPRIWRCVECGTDLIDN